MIGATITAESAHSRIVQTSRLSDSTRAKGWARDMGSSTLTGAALAACATASRGKRSHLYAALQDDHLREDVHRRDQHDVEGPPRHGPARLVGKHRQSAKPAQRDFHPDHAAGHNGQKPRFATITSNKLGESGGFMLSDCRRRLQTPILHGSRKGTEEVVGKRLSFHGIFVPTTSSVPRSPQASRSSRTAIRT